METKLTSIEHQTRTLQEVNEKLTRLTTRVERSEEKMTEIENKVIDLDGNLQGCSNLFDGLKEKSEKVSTDLKELGSRVSCTEVDGRSMTMQMNSLVRRCEEMEEKVKDQQCRSMKYNIIFSGIQESEGNEDCEKIIKEFIAEKLKVEGEIPLVNVHRIGNRSKARRGGRPRSIIAKFLYYKDMQRVKGAGKQLKGTSFGMNEQFPAEVEEVRKKLYPIAKEERRKGKKVVLLRDRLYVEDELIIPERYEWPQHRSDASARPPRPPPRHKRTRYNGSTPDRSVSFGGAMASTPYVNS
ncbi:hypothetical protein FSP39_006248 [Pinctada imbricata]|uniref:Uncharacterized protein n=1 Tax=Pinctada imbricata TaxID=66713 RepID=A0AA88Y3G7_PINIB|nr:hypothetical protein FSP39_006248 [Pinctada imbricata]